MIKILRIGDPHVKVNNLEESEVLMRYALELATNEKVNRIEILGDLFHTHSVLRLEVLNFWHKWLTIFCGLCETVVLEGNHDQSGDYSNAYSALSVFKLYEHRNLKVVTEPWLLGRIGYIPYTHDNESFLAKANGLAEQGATVLVVHQTLMGSKYESGFYASDGADTTKISDKVIHIISGHIHSKQEFGRVSYPGTGRWDNAADANQPKGLHVFEHDTEGGQVIGYRFFSTEKVCSPLYQLCYREGEPEPVIPEGRVVLEMTGSSDWIAKEKLKFKGKASINTKITDAKKLENRRSGINLEDFIRNIYNTNTDKEALLQCAKELGIA